MDAVIENIAHLRWVLSKSGARLAEGEGEDSSNVDSEVENEYSIVRHAVMQ